MLIIVKNLISRSICGLNTETLQSFLLTPEGEIKGWAVGAILEQMDPGSIDRATRAPGWERLW